jgi:hypothetical protein
MIDKPEWLPPLVKFLDYSGDWDKYLSTVYGFFERDFIKNKPRFRREKVNIKRHPVINGKEATFWHLISEGKYEEDRLPNIRRCERVRWPFSIIENCDREINIKIWENERGGEGRVCIWLSFENEDYLVVLAKRSDYLLFWTAYPLTYENTKRKLQKEYETYKAEAAL